MTSDEEYILDLCDEILDRTGMRQHRFDFLRGDPGMNGRTVTLPVDIYYPSLNLVIEYHGRQHTEDVHLFNRRMTISGVSRREQRLIYDERRRATLPKHGIHVAELSYEDFGHSSRKRLNRNRIQDKNILRAKLSHWIKG